MISLRKYKSRYIAASSTVLILLLLFGLFSLEFSGESSSVLNPLGDDNLKIQLEDILAEDIPFLPSGKDPLSNQKDKSSESLSEKKGPLKSRSIAPPLVSAAPTEDEPQAAVSPDTVIIKKIEVVQALKIEPVKLPNEDTTVVNEFSKILQKTKNNNINNERYKKEREKYQYYKGNYKNIRNFKKVYPYALKTKQIIDSLNMQLSTMTNESDKKKLIKETEKMLFKEYESAVRNMSTSQGKLLLKLISRETSKTGYEIIKDYKGSLPASFWYGVGKLFGTDLKSEFHKEKEDSLIEEILKKYINNDLY